MKILFDQGTPVPLRKHLLGHDIVTAFEMGWSRLSNGDLIKEAEKAQFKLMITTDQNLRYQQNLEKRSIAIIVLRGTSWPKMQKKLNLIAEVVQNIQGSDYIEVELD